MSTRPSAALSRIHTTIRRHVTVPAAGDELLWAGKPDARWALDTTLVMDSAAVYVLTGERRPVGWLWRRLSRAPAVDEPVEAELRR